MRSSSFFSSLLCLLIGAPALGLPPSEQEMESSQVHIQTITNEVSTPPQEERQSQNFRSEIFFDLSLEHRLDQLRELQNNQITSVRSFSLGVELFKGKSFSLLAELLSDQMIEGETNVNIGELYVNYAPPFFDEDKFQLNLRAGVVKLGYGILNRQDGQFAFLPSYYKILYDLPRGLDTGVQAELQLAQQFYASVAGYAGQNLRTTDGRVRDFEVLPHHFQIGMRNEQKTQDVSLHYFSRQYFAQPLVRGFGLQGVFLQLLSQSSWRIDLESEFWYLQNSLNNLDQEGLTGLVAPKISYKKIFIQPIVAWENWQQGDSESLMETYGTLKLGYEINQYLKLLVERTQIRNRDTEIASEDSFQFRILSQFRF
jgi:hypothetical protein